MANTTIPDQNGFTRRGGALATLLVMFGIVAPAGAMGLGALTGIGGLIAVSKNRFGDVLKAATKPPPALIAFWAFIVWTGLSFAWSPTHEADYVGVLLGIAILPPLVGWTAKSKVSLDTEIIRKATLVGSLILTVGLLAEAFFGYPISKLTTSYDDVGALVRNLARGGVCALALCFVAAAAAERLGMRRSISTALVLGGGVVAFQFNVIANPIAFFAACLAGGVALILPRIAITGLFGSAALLVLGAPIIYPAASALGRTVSSRGELSLSWELRARMWDFATARIAEQPWIGWGFQSARTFDDPIVVRGWTVTQLQIHPHSAPLHLWLETGLIGAALATIALAIAGWTLGKALANDRVIAAGLCAATTVLLIVYAFSYSLWDDWLVALCSVTAAGLIASRQSLSEQRTVKAVSESEFVPL